MFRLRRSITELMAVVSLIFWAVSANWVIAMTQACRKDGESDLEAALWSLFRAESGHRSPNTRPVYTRDCLSITDLCVADHWTQFGHANAVRRCGIN